MLYILHEKEDVENVALNIVPLLEEENFKLLEYPFSKEPELIEDDTLITYLGDESLHDLISVAAKKQWPLGVLPHPNNNYTIKGLGVSANLGDAISEILGNGECEKLDLLYCNGKLVFQAVNIGDVFALTTNPVKNNFTTEVYTFIRNLRKIPSLKHRSFLLSSGGEKVIHTSALGMIAVEHPLSSVISKRLVTTTSIDDGMFHLLILSPQNVIA